MNKCVVCKNNTKNSIRLNGFDGFCYSSRAEYICLNCLDKNTIYTNDDKYLVLDDKVYLNKFGLGVYELVCRKEHFRHFLNKRRPYILI
jgi:hypothetical protein